LTTFDIGDTIKTMMDPKQLALDKKWTDPKRAFFKNGMNLDLNDAFGTSDDLERNADLVSICGRFCVSARTLHFNDYAKTFASPYQFTSRLRAEYGSYESELLKAQKGYSQMTIRDYVDGGILVGRLVFFTAVFHRFPLVANFVAKKPVLDISSSRVEEYFGQGFESGVKAHLNGNVLFLDIDLEKAGLLDFVVYAEWRGEVLKDRRHQISLEELAQSNSPSWAAEVAGIA